MAFDVPADDYGRFMGRYAELLAPLFADAAGVRAGQRVLDVGCGPGALTAVLAHRVGAGRVTAVEPSEPFLEAVRARLPEVDVRPAVAERLPFEDDTFDAALAQLVVHFMDDPVAGLREMARVTRPGGTVAACVWDHGGGRGPLSPFWRVAREVDPSLDGERRAAGAHRGDLARLAGEAGLQDAVASELSVHVHYDTFDEWWTPYTLGVGPAGDHVAALSPEDQHALRLMCLRSMPVAPFAVHATAFCVVARA